MAQQLLDDLRRQRLFILPSLAPKEVGEKAAPRSIVKMDIFEIQRQKAIERAKKGNMSEGEKKTQKAKKKVKTTFEFSSQLKEEAERKRKLAHLESHSECRGDYGNSITRSVVGSESDFIPYSTKKIGLYDSGCLTCGRENVETKYHGQRHICPDCRKHLKTYNNDKVLVYLDQKGRIQCKAVRLEKNVEGEVTSSFIYECKPDQIKIFEYRAYATLSGRDELIVLLNDDQNMPLNKLDRPLISSRKFQRSGSRSPRKMTRIAGPNSPMKKLQFFKSVSHLRQSSGSNFGFTDSSWDQSSEKRRFLMVQK